MKRIRFWPLMVLCGAIMISFALVPDSYLRGQDDDTALMSPESSDSFLFRLEVGGQPIALYTECFGLGSSNEIEEAVILADSGAVTQKTPGVLDWHNITLRRTGVSDGKVWEWRQAMVDGQLDEAITDGAIVMFSASELRPLAEWDFSRGWVSSLTMEGSVEVLTIVHEGVKRVTQGQPVYGR